MILLFPSLLQLAAATTWPAPPPTLSGRLAAAAVAGEFRAVVATTVFVEGTPVTHLELQPVTVVRGGSTGNITLILPGGIVGGQFEKGFPDAFQVVAGETLFVILQPAIGMSGYYNTAYSFRESVFRLVDTGTERLMEDPYGRVVIDLPCDGRPTYAVAPPIPAAQASADTNERGELAGPRMLPEFVEVTNPSSLGIDWATGIDTLAACGGAP